jgi:hypothetical protein
MHDGVRLCAQFSLATSELEYCGPPGASALLRRALLSGEGIREASAALLRFEALEPYLSALALKHRREPLDYSVVEAYWIGNELLEGFTRADFAHILSDLARRGLPKGLAQKLAARLPESPIPHHAFHVFFVGVGRVTGKVATTLRNMDNCRPSWGLVTRRRPGMALVERQPLEDRGGNLALGEPVEVEVAVDAALEREVHVGEYLAIHWGQAASPLPWDRRAHLELYTLKAIEAANASSSAPGRRPPAPHGEPAAAF